MVLIPKKDATLEIVVTADSQDEVRLICRRPTAEEKDKWRRRRIRIRGNRSIVDFDVDLKFMRSILIGCKNIEIEPGVPLDPAQHENWKQILSEEPCRDWLLTACLAFLPDAGRIHEVGESDAEDF